MYVIINDVKKSASYRHGHGYGIYDAKTQKPWWKRLVKK